MRKIIVDCDIGNGIAGANVDDGLALALALASPEIEVKAVTTVSGNVLNFKACLVARHFLQESGYDVPVYCGSFRALKEPTQKWRERLDHGVEKQGLKYLWQDTEENFSLADTGIDSNAVEKMAQIINDNPHEITIIAIGPLTNVAALFNQYPEVVNKIQEIVLMGGTITVNSTLGEGTTF
ncbi:nucleoside hydrolase, partial [Succinatimonas hippei]|uniref:nucleoside hydrolase n=1 Tax=Succinatimonas hippei TaxID=626938 RepID=UPI00249050FD